MSDIRKRYVIRLILRCVVFAICCSLCIYAPGQFDILEGMAFFSAPSLLHILWLVWVLDMFQQLVPLKSKISLGSQKLFSSRFKPIRDRIDMNALRNYILTTTRAAYKVLLLWFALVAIIGVIYFTGVIGKTGLFMISVLFYICDLICVLIWCPFRLLMKTRCCTTCRIFNWDHLMMFSPLIFMGGFFGISLVLMALAAWVMWELFILVYPERFWEKSNAALKCSECTDKLCTQYCKKLRK